LRTPASYSPWVGFSAIAVGTFMSTLDGSIVNVALPSIRSGFGASISGVGWIVTAYLLAVSATLLAAGRLGDILGLRRVFTGGMLLFTLASGLCGLAGSLPVLVAARALQAMGAAAMMAMAPAALTAIFPPHQRGRALGGISSVVAAGLTAGPPIGGLLVAHLSWRAIFYVNLPVGVAGAIWASRALPGGSEARGARFDGRGALWLALALAAGIGAVDLAPQLRAGSLGLAAAAATGAVLLWRRERAAPSPLLDAGLFRDRVFSWGLGAGLLSYAAMFSQVLLTPFFLSEVKGLGPGAMGGMLLGVPLALSLSAPVAGWLSDRFGPRWPCLAGMALLAAALVSLALAHRGDSLAAIFARLALAGMGMGLFQPPNNSAVMGTLPRARLGSGGGMLATSRNLGMVLGVALSGALFSLGAGNGGLGDFLAGWRLALLAGASLAVAAGLLSLARPHAPAP
jgi:EmrB/QacA subfamily drug resistance transporter